MENIVSTSEAAQMLEVSRQWVLKLIDEGKLEAKKIGTSYAINLDDVKRYRREVQGKNDLEGGE